MNTVLPKQFIVAGIGTEIGKTVVSAILVERLRADYWKPIQSGGLDDSDTDTVRRLITNSTSVFYPEAYRLTQPLSPHAAAAIDSVTINLEHIVLPKTANALVVELAGGLMVPLNDTVLIIDLVQRLNLPVVLVSKNYLGSINHTLLSVEACRNRHIPVLGIIFNGPTVPATEDYILRYTGLPCLARISQLDTVNRDTIAQLAATLALDSPSTPGKEPTELEPATLTLAERDKAIIWHPFTQMQTALLPIPIVRGVGSLLYDACGNEYIDAISSWWVNLHGHAHPYIAKRVATQLNTLEHVIFADFTHQPAVELAERLLAILPQNQARVFYSDNGSTAVEVALKMAFQYWHNLEKPRQKVVALHDAYHGDTFGAMAVGGRSAFTAPFVPFLFDVEYLPTPVPGQETKVLTLARALFTDEVAAFIIEPLVQGAGGMLMYEPAVLDELIRLARQAGILVIADEVMTGFGRTGRLFASHHLQEQPDLMCLSKGITGGTMALGVTTCAQVVYDAFLSDSKFKTLFHGHSFTANPVACTAALASMDLLLSAQTQTSIQRIADRHAAFAETLQTNSVVNQVRQRGTLLAFDLVINGETSYFNTIRDRAYKFLLKRGVLMRPLGNVLYLMPPYCTTDAQLTRVYGEIDALLKELAADRVPPLPVFTPPSSPGPGSGIE